VGALGESNESSQSQTAWTRLAPPAGCAAAVVVVWGTTRGQGGTIEPQLSSNFKPSLVRILRKRHIRRLDCSVCGNTAIVTPNVAIYDVNTGFGLCFNVFLWSKLRQTMKYIHPNRKSVYSFFTCGSGRLGGNPKLIKKQ
jgi:hypothetical protein